MLFTAPAHRRRGAGQMCLDWGINQADSRGYEMFLEATIYGKPLYERNNYMVVEEYTNAPQTDTPDDDWNEIAQKVPPFTMWLMWRPPHGDKGRYVDGSGLARPWEVAE